MPFNGSGGTTQPAGSIYPATANTLIESAKSNASIADIYTMLASCIVKDGQTTTTQRIPFAAGASMGSQTITAVADGTAVTHAATVGQVRSGAPVLLGSVAGTNTITAALTPALTAYAAGNKFILTPANTNTGATTVNVDSVGAKNIFWNGAACVGGELRQNIPALIEYDGTQFHIVGNGFNAPFLDTHAVVEGSADSTKKLRFEVDGLTTATTRVATPPDEDFTMVGVATAQTLTNKTLTSPVINTGVSGTAIADQTAMEAGASTSLLVTPGRQQFHPSSAKGWSKAGVVGSSVADYNLTGVVDDGSGLITFTWNVDFSTANYVAVYSFQATAFNGAFRISAQAAGTTQIQVTDLAGVATDPVSHQIAVFGDQ